MLNEGRLFLLGYWSIESRATPVQWTAIKLRCTAEEAEAFIRAMSDDVVPKKGGDDGSVS